MRLRDYKATGYGDEVENLLNSQSEAAEAGEQYYFTGKPCRSGHVSHRYTAGGVCVQCTRERNVKRLGAGTARPGKRAISNLERTIASRNGETTYVPTFPCKHGHRLRFTASNNCVKCDAYNRARRKERYRESRLQKLYGLTSSRIKAIIRDDQGGRCPICEEKIKGRAYHVDHCHKRGYVRGILCQKCNQALGLLRECPAVARNAARYLENA